MMSGWMMAALALAAPAAKPPAAAQGWSIAREGHACRMSRVFQGAGLNGLVVSYDFQADSSVLSFFDSSIRSLKSGDRKKLRVRLRKGNVSDDSWGKVAFTANASDDNAGTLFSAKLTSTILQDMARSSGISFWYGDTLLKSYALDGSTAAIAKLRACARDVAMANPTDPFRAEKRRKPSIFSHILVPEDPGAR